MRNMLWKSLIAAVGVSALAAPIAANQPQDAFITTKVKMELIKSEGLDPFRINVDTFDGIVTLHGQVDSATEKTKAEQEARGVKGVKNVRDLLAVVPKNLKDQVAASDDQIQKRVETALESDGSLQNSHIKVNDVHAGTVVLSGNADTLSSHYRALQDARHVAGVKKVASEIQSPDEMGDKEIWSDKPAPEGMKSSAHDTWVTTKVKASLLSEPGLSPTSVNVDTQEGVVTLFGEVANANDKAAAERSAKKVDGVKTVKNELQVVPKAEAKRVEARDDQLEKMVKERIQEHAGLKNDQIKVEVKNGVVRLTGTVNAAIDRINALTVARSTEGVKSVIDDLQIDEKKG